MDPLPFELKDQMIQCFGRSFHYKDSVESFMRSAGVPIELAARYKDKPKFVWARSVINDLEASKNGRIIQRRLLTELCKLRNVTEDVPDREAGLDALRKLKNLTNEHQIEIEEKQTKTSNRINALQARQELIEERGNRLQELRERFYKNVIQPNRQKAGYSLEDLLKDLFALSEIEYKKSYRTDTQQIDGHFWFEGFNYLVEAKWRQDMPNEGEIGSFKRKVDTKLEATRGLFISISGFRDEVIGSYFGRNNIIFMNGEDLMHILEGRINLTEALKIKIENAAQYGHAYCKIF